MKGAWGSNQRKRAKQPQRDRGPAPGESAAPQPRRNDHSSNSDNVVMDTSKKKAKIGRTQLELIHCKDVTVIDDVPERKSYENHGRNNDIKKPNSDNIVDISKKNNVSRRSNGFDRTIDFKKEIVDADAPSPESNILEVLQEFDISNVETKILFESDEEDSKSNLNFDASVNNNVEIVDVKNFDSHKVISQEIRQEPTCDQPSETCRESDVIQNSHASDGKTEADTKENAFDNIADGSYALKSDPNKCNSNLQDKDLTMDVNDDINNECCCENTVARNAETKPDDKDNCLNDVGKGSFLAKTDINETKSLIENDMNENSSLPKCVFDIGKSFAEEKTYCENYFLKVDETEDRRVLFSVGLRSRRKLSPKNLVNDARIRKFVRNSVSEIEENNGKHHKMSTDRKLLMHPAVVMKKMDDQLLRELPHRSSTISPSQLSPRKRFRPSCFTTILSPTFRKKNIKLLNLCKPCVVLLKRLESHKRMARRIELLNIEDVRRNNRSLLFAEVAPLTSCQDELSSPESPTSSSDEEWTPDIADPPAPLRHKSLASLGQAHIDNKALATATTIVGQKGNSNRHKTKKLPWPFTTGNQVGLNSTTKQLLRHLLVSRNLRKKPQAPINSSPVQDTASQAASEPSKISFSSLSNFSLNQAVPVPSNRNPSIIDPTQLNYITIQPQTQLNLQQHPMLDVAQVVQKGVQNSKAPVQFSVTNSIPHTQYMTPQNCPQSAIVAGLKGQPTFVPQDTTTQTTNMSTIVNIPDQHNTMPGLTPTQGIQGAQENVTLNQIGAEKIPQEISFQRLNSTKAGNPSQPNTMVLACEPTRSQENPLQNQQMGTMQMSQNISSQRDNSTMANIPNQTNILWSAQVQNAMGNQTNMLMNQEMKALQMKKEISQKVNAPTLINIANQPNMMMIAQVQNTILKGLLQGSTMTQHINVLQKPQEILQRNNLTITNNSNQTNITMTPQVQNAVRDQAGIMNQQICASQMLKEYPMLDVAQVVQNRVQNSNAPVQNLVTNSMPQTQYMAPKNCPQPAIVAGLKGQPTFVPQDTTTQTTNMSTIVNIPTQHNAMPGLTPTQGIQGTQENVTLNQIGAVKIPQEITLQRLNSTKPVIPSQPNTMVLACKPTRSQEKTLQNQQKSALQKVNTPTIDNISNKSNVHSAKFQNTVLYQKGTQNQQMDAMQRSQNISLSAQVQNVVGNQTNMHMNQEMKDLQITEEISQKVNAPTFIKISHQPNMTMTAQVQNTILKELLQGSTMTEHMNVSQKPQVISQRDNLTITNNPNQANITMTPRVQNAIRNQPGIMNQQICTLQMPKEISSQIVYPTITNIPNQPNITQGGLNATGVMLNPQISAIQMPQDIPQGANSFAIPTIGAIPGQSTSSPSDTNASQVLMNQQMNAVKPAWPINSIQANSAANSLVFAPILGPSGLPESWVIKLVGPQTNPIQNSLYPDINSTNTGCNSKPNLLNSMPNTMPQPAPWAVASERGVPYTTVNPSNIQGNTQLNLQDPMQSGLSQLTPMIVNPEQGSSDVSLNPSHTWSNPRPNLVGPMNNELLKPALTITDSTCCSINPLLQIQTTVPQGNSISTNPMHVMGTSVNASQTNMPLLLQHNPMPISLVQATETPVNSLQASIQKAAEAPVKPKASLQKQKVPALIPYSKWVPLRVQTELDSMEFMKRLGWGTCVPSYEWVVGRDPNTLRVLCTPREACWTVGRCLVVSEAELPTPQFFVWAVSPRVRLLLPPDDFTPVDAKETSTKDPEARTPPWLKAQTSGQHQKAEAKAPALPRLYLNDNAFQKLCDEPLTYAKLLVAVRSARACRAALARGAPLQLYDVETCRLYPVYAKPNNGEVQLSLCGAAEVTDTLLSLGQQLNQLPDEKLTGEMAQADFQKRKLQLLNPGADRRTNHINHIAAPHPFIKGASAKDFFDLPDNQFLDIFRLPKARVELLTEELRPFLKNTKYPMYGMTLEKKVLLTLRFLATGEQQPTDAVRAGVGDVCASRAVAEVVAALNQHAVLQKYMQFPGRQDRDEIRHRFMELYKLPGVIGVIDGMQVSTTPQTADEGAGSSHKLNVVIICDADLNIMSVDATHDGLTLDAEIWARHPANKHLKALRAEGEDVWLLGDSGFPQHEVLMTPLQTPLDDASARYCELHARAHSTIVRCFAALRARWRCLVTQKLPYKPQVAAKIVNACAVLHNIANRYEYKMEVPWQSFEVEEQEWRLATKYDAKQELSETFLATASKVNQKQALAEIERGCVARLRLIQYLSLQPVTT